VHHHRPDRPVDRGQAPPLATPFGILPPMPASAAASRLTSCGTLTNGGSGGMHYALANGVLLVVVGATEE
jgi:hypothetical protein